jgi:hypothetical protein
MADTAASGSSSIVTTGRIPLCIRRSKSPGPMPPVISVLIPASGSASWWWLACKLCSMETSTRRFPLTTPFSTS